MVSVEHLDQIYIKEEELVAVLLTLLSDANSTTTRERKESRAIAIAIMRSLDKYSLSQEYVVKQKIGKKDLAYYKNIGITKPGWRLVVHWFENDENIDKARSEGLLGRISNKRTEVIRQLIDQMHRRKAE